MIYFETLPVVNDDELDSFVYDFVTGAIKEKLFSIIKCYETKKDYEDELYHGEDMLDEYFPPSFPKDNKEEMLRIMKGLYCLINAKDAWTPTLLMEYVLAKIIKSGIGDFYSWVELVTGVGLGNLNNYNNELLKTYTHKVSSSDLSRFQNKKVNFPFTKEFSQKWKEAYIKYLEEEDGDDEDIGQAAEDTLNELWHFSPYWLEWCFMDNDYTFLNEMSMGEIRHSFINSYIGIVSKNAKDESFYIPVNWETSKDFKFLN